LSGLGAHQRGFMHRMAEANGYWVPSWGLRYFQRQILDGLIERGLAEKLTVTVKTLVNDFTVETDEAETYQLTRAGWDKLLPCATTDCCQVPPAYDLAKEGYSGWSPEPGC
jgi:hypothetical protein